MALPLVQIYVAFSVLLVLNLLGLWVLSGVTRGKTKTTLNEEDAKTIAQGSRLTETEPEEIRRVLRAHANALANIVPFVILGQLYLSVANPKPNAFFAICAIFTLARYGHSFAYVNGKQPWRSAFWAIGLLATIALIVLLLIGTFG